MVAVSAKGSIGRRCTCTCCKSGNFQGAVEVSGVANILIVGYLHQVFKNVGSFVKCDPMLDTESCGHMLTYLILLILVPLPVGSVVLEEVSVVSLEV